MYEATRSFTGWRINDEAFDRVLLASSATDAARLCDETAADAPETRATDLQACAARAGALRHEAITTVYAMAPTGLPRPMLALRTDPEHPAQFVFDRGQLGGTAGLLAFERETLQARVVSQALVQLGQVVHPVQTLTERRATFACTPGLARPAMRVTDGLCACGDYVDGPYPATLEGAVRNGWAAGCLP